MNAETVTRLLGDLRLGERACSGAPYIYAKTDNGAWWGLHNQVERVDHIGAPCVPYIYEDVFPSTRVLVEAMDVLGAKEVFIVVAYATARPYSPTLNFDAFADALYTNTINGDEHDPNDVADELGPWWYSVDTVYAHRVTRSALTQHKTRGGLGFVLGELGELEEMFKDSMNDHATSAINLLAEYIRAH
jgi:hypothetical protein